MSEGIPPKWSTCEKIARNTDSLNRSQVVEFLSECHTWNLETLNGQILVGIGLGLFVGYVGARFYLEEKFQRKLEEEISKESDTSFQGKSVEEIAETTRTDEEFLRKIRESAEDMMMEDNSDNSEKDGDKDD